jgi:hypothetical protein
MMVLYVLFLRVFFSLVLVVILFKNSKAQKKTEGIDQKCTQRERKRHARRYDFTIVLEQK